MTLNSRQPAQDTIVLFKKGAKNWWTRYWLVFRAFRNQRNKTPSSQRSKTPINRRSMVSMRLFRCRRFARLHNTHRAAPLDSRFSRKRLLHLPEPLLILRALHITQRATGPDCWS